MSDPQDPQTTVPPTGAHEVLAPDGIRSGSDGERSPESSDERESSSPDGGIESPAKIIRIGAMVKQMLEEVRSTSVDDAARDQIRRVYESSVDQLKAAMSTELGEELDTLAFDFGNDEPPSEAELRMAQAQLVGWLEGLFHGIQATLVAQQMAARQQLEGMRGQLPGGPGAPSPNSGPGPGYI